MVSFSRTSRGFTLIEIMIVIAMIVMLLSSGFFPYAYYMDRARVEKTIDTISQDWIIAHQDIRGGKLHDGGPSHAYIEIEMNVGDNFIKYSTYTGGVSPRKEYKKYTFDSTIEILGFTGTIDPGVTNLKYHITPPFATGSFSTGSTDTYLSGIILIVGYPEATLESRRAREVLLRPYFD